MHWKLILTYDGTPYNGWQIQPNLPTVQGTLAEAIHRITGETVLPQGSGRTDAGVHALGQVATFTLNAPIPEANLHRALNRALPASIRVLSVEAVPEDFHARHSALRKTYEYRILPGDRICPPMLAPYVWSCRYSLDLATLQQAAQHVLGTHDFTSFAANDPDLTTRDEQRAPATQQIRSLLPIPYSLLPASPAPSSTPPGTSTKTSSSTASPAPASFTTWSATSSAPSSKQPPTASPPTQSQPSSPRATAAPQAPPPPPAASSS